MITVRRAGRFDARDMADLLNAIIRRGGTTALTQEETAESLQAWMQEYEQTVFHLAEDAAGVILGFQFNGPHPDLPPEACAIAPFVRVGQTGLGIGSRLFEASLRTARDLGYAWINATIRADNAGGLAYYQSRGFEDYARHPAQRLANGLIVDKISKRYEV